MKAQVDPRRYSGRCQDVAVFTHNYGRGKTSALEVGPFATKGAVLFQVRGGEVTRLVAYFNRRRALADFGLPQEAGPSDS
jgi:hypothetical protein